jgi:hypothetical protein
MEVFGVAAAGESQPEAQQDMVLDLLSSVLQKLHSHNEVSAIARVGAHVHAQDGSKLSNVWSILGEPLALSALTLVCKARELETLVTEQTSSQRCVHFGGLPSNRR